ncbi:MULTISPECIES: radical SAM family heme chaperone HemW [Exiguobacterium]|uniref:radical SAM family heme chaperone HemW n=1 Tax=Exiguobacterium TaxID=33986 RepID=UPI001BEB212E|nr:MULTISPECIES: radical SAM family heme chaperone HemW [Exiguobacterium]
MGIRAAYVHIPFCEHICYYCDFNKVFLKNQPVDEYLDALEREIELTLKQYPTDHLETIFIGGGTPTALNEPQMQRLMEIIQKHLLPLTGDDLEYTVESNPDGVSEEKLDIMKAGGVNRVSFGVQSFDDGLLERIGRTHREAKVAQTLDAAAKRFDNISVDLMFGLPNQTLDQVRYDVTRALQLPITHISSYSLILEPHTVFAIQERKGKLPLPTQDLEAEMYQVMIDTIEAGGYAQYEISNFAQTGKESRHNRVYWENDEYYGFGAGSHSYINQTRRANIAPIPHYIKAEGLPVRKETPLTNVERMEEEMFLGLRMKDGVSLERFQTKYGVAFEDVFGDVMKRLLPNGLVEQTETHIRLTPAGIPLANEVFAEFIGEAQVQ